MEFTEEDIALSLANASEEKKAEVLETFRNLQRKSEHINQQNDLLKLDIGSFRDELTSMGVGRRVARLGTRGQNMNPALWGTLPDDLLKLIFAHLPLYEIIRLRVSSKTWNGYVTGMIDSSFAEVCARVNPKIFAMVCDDVESSPDNPERPHDGAGLLVMLHDTGSNKWRMFTHNTSVNDYIDTMRAGDGGLVCAVSCSSDKKECPLRIVVFNPLTRQQRELPELPDTLSSIQPSMVQLVMDRKRKHGKPTKCYKVIAVVPKSGDAGGVEASIYSSETGQWISAKAFTDLIFGYYHKWSIRSFDLEVGGPKSLCVVNSRGPCAYDCANGKLIDLDDASSPCKGPLDSYALVKDRLFVLHKMDKEFSRWNGGVFQREVYCISEYQAQKRQPHWVKLRVHSCKEFEFPPRDAVYDIHLFAWDGFLLVTAHNGEVSGFRHNIAWLYDLSTNRWRKIQGVPDDGTPREVWTMFELQWDAVP